jgi:Uma2 family endonuclease
MKTRTEATIEDLYHMPENSKAELVNGEIVPVSPTGGLSNRAAGSIYVSLRVYERKMPGYYAFTDNAGFIVNLPNRRSFSPDVAFYRGEVSGKFLQGAPVFAVEVRSEGDYGPDAERAMSQKRTDYFKAGTLVVWDVDVLQDRVVRVYRADDQNNPTTYSPGQTAEAEPALPGWTIAVDDIFA